ncbi:hypothetical protein ABBQ38_009540 [Trebouxia sp. C0009 RCD-2024]
MGASCAGINALLMGTFPDCLLPTHARTRLLERTLESVWRIALDVVAILTAVSFLAKAKPDCNSPFQQDAGDSHSSSRSNFRQFPLTTSVCKGRSAHLSGDNNDSKRTASLCRTRRKTVQSKRMVLVRNSLGIVHLLLHLCVSPGGAEDTQPSANHKLHRGASFCHAEHSVMFIRNLQSE